MTKVLRIDASMRHDGSTTRSLTDKVIARLAPSEVVTRDLADGIDLITAEWIGANFTEPAERTDIQNAALDASNTMVAELKAADTLVIGVPVYNFGVPAALKAWVDQIARARVTFKYTETGPEGLLEGKRAIVVIASGGTPVDSEIDFATPYMRHVLGFVGIHDVTVIGADRQMADPDAAIARATDRINALAA
ncbi:MAG: NAD(P)H-dependent oxidoreductase [Pseudomonadota bacterium]